MKSKNSAGCLASKTEMKRESVSGPEDKSTEINQSEEDWFFFFLKEQNFKDMWDKTQKVTHVYYWIPGSGGEWSGCRKSIWRNNGRQNPKPGGTLIYRCFKPNEPQKR